MQTEKSYVEMRDGQYAVIGHRVPLAALAAFWRDGASPETICENYRKRAKYPSLRAMGMKARSSADDTVPVA